MCVFHKPSAEVHKLHWQFNDDNNDVIFGVLISNCRLIGRHCLSLYKSICIVHIYILYVILGLLGFDWLLQRQRAAGLIAKRVHSARRPLERAGFMRFSEHIIEKLEKY